MKRSLYFVFAAFLAIAVISNVSAEENEILYINNNGLTFNQFQYETMVDILDEQKVENMTYMEYQYFDVASLTADNFTYNTYEAELSDGNGGLMLLSTYHETSYKKLTIGCQCNTERCRILTTCEWKGNPAVRSYDMIGVRLSSTQFYNDTRTGYIMMQDGTYVAESGYKKTSNGAASAIKLPSSGNVSYASQTVFVNHQGVVYGSYQHGVRSMTLNKALNFTFSSVGIGGVFNYPSSYGTLFDEMAGVDINLNNI